jgi:hypothetical protein
MPQPAVGDENSSQLGSQQGSSRAYRQLRSFVGFGYSLHSSPIACQPSLLMCEVNLV